eukprot:159781_1
MSEELKALDVLVSYINDHNGNIPQNPNKLVSYSCEHLDLPTLDYFQARTIMNTYQKNVDTLRLEQRKSKQDYYSKSKPQSKQKSSHYNSTSTDEESNSDSTSQKQHHNIHHKRHHNPHQQYKHSSYSEQTHESSTYSTTNSNTNSDNNNQYIQQHKHNKHNYTSPKQQKYNSNSYKPKHKQNRRQQTQKSFYSSTSTDSETDSDTDTDSDIKPSHTHHKTYTKTPIKQKHTKTQSGNPFTHDKYKHRTHFRTNTNPNNRNKDRQKAISDDKIKHKRKYKPQKQKRSHRSHQRISTQSNNRNVNNNNRKQKPRDVLQKRYDVNRYKHRNKINKVERTRYNDDNYKYERPKKQMKVTHKTRDDFPQHSGYSNRVRMEHRYHRSDNSNSIELETPQYDHEQTSEDTTESNSSVSNESSLHSTELSNKRAYKYKKKQVTIVRTHPVSNVYDERMKRKQRRGVYRNTTNPEVELEIIPTSKNNIRNSNRNTIGERGDMVRKNRKTKMKHDANETKVKHNLKSSKYVENDGKDDASEDNIDIECFGLEFDKQCKKIFYIVIGVIFCIGCILCAILIPLSLKRVEFSESAIRYNDLTKKTDNEPYSEGRYIVTPQTKMFTFDIIIQKLTLELNCLTSDGIVMDIEVTIQYSIPYNNIYKIWNDYGKEGKLEKYFKLIATDSIRDSVGLFTAGAFYRNRYNIQNKIENDLFDAGEQTYTYLNMVSVILSGYSYPEDLKETIRVKRNAENDIELAKNERNGNITDAETTLLIAGINARRMELQGRAEKESILAEAYAKADVITKEFEYRTQLMLNIIEKFNMTNHQFIEGWLTAFVLYHAHEPYTTTLVRNSNNSGLLLGMRL